MELEDSYSEFKEADREVLQAELRQKEKDLILAGRLGKELLEENECLKADLNSLQRDLTNLEELLEGQKQDSLKALHDAKKIAELHISELEVELDNCRCSLQQERAAATSNQEEFRRTLKLLQEENTRLQSTLSQTMHKHENELMHLNKKLELCEKQKWIVTVDHTTSQKYLEALQDKNQTMGTTLSSLSKSCDKLSMELDDSRDEIEFWENQFHSQEEMFQSQSKELNDSKELLKELQLQLDHDQSLKVRHGSRESMSSGLSLYDELSSMDEMVEDTRSLSPNSTSDDEKIPEEEKTLTLRPFAGNTPFRRFDSNQTRMTEDNSNTPIRRFDSNQTTISGMTEDDNKTVVDASQKETLCHRCQELAAQNKKQEAELRIISGQLMLAVQQKFKLQQQVEAWQSDMAEVVYSKIVHKLTCLQGRKPADKLCKDHQVDNDDYKKNTASGRLAFHMIKDSWLF